MSPEMVGPGWSELERQVPDATVQPATDDEWLFCPTARSLNLRFEAVATEASATMVVLGAPAASPDRPYGVIERLWSDNDTAGLLAEVRAALRECAGRPWTAGAGETVVVTSFEGLAALGDESVAAMFTASEPTESGDVDWHVPTVFVRVGSVLAVLQALDVHRAGALPRFTTDDLERIFRSAIDLVQKGSG